MEPLISGDGVAIAVHYLPYAIPVCGVCLWLYWASTEKDLQCRRLIILPLVVAIWFESSGAALAQGATNPATTTATTAATAASEFPTVTRTIEGVAVQLPDWSQINFDSLGGMLEAGNVTIPAELAGELGFDKITWNVGDKLSDVLPMGALSECLGLDKLTQGAINKITGTVTSNLPLSQFAPTALQNISSLAEAVPGLASLTVGNVLPIQDLLEKALGSGLNIPGLSDVIGQISNVTQMIDTAGNIIGSLKDGNVVDAAGQVLGALGADGKVLNSAGEVTGVVNQAGEIINQAGQVMGTVRSVIQSPLSLLQMPIGQLVSQFPQLGQLGLNNLDLSKYIFSQIPGLENTPIGRLLDWQKVLLSGIPGLSKLPLNQFPNPLAEAMNAFVARVDVPLDEKEQKHTTQSTVSGSYQQGFRVPCEKNCAQAELTPIAGSQMDKANMGAFSNGKSWISGKHQQVEGGEGVLKVVNGGKEPTGRNPYCSVFKQVITKVDQPGGKIGTSMYFRFCKHSPVDLGCTPYFLGPIPFLSYKEKAFIYLGEANPKDDGGGIDMGGNDDPLSSQDGFNDCGSKLSGDATNSAVKAVDKVAQTVNDGAMQVPSSQARDDVERIMAEMQRQGVTCPAQMAYILATAHRESTMGTNMTEFKDTASSSSGGTQYYGRGYVQLTGRSNYAAATQYLRSQGINVDLVANPELAARPDIAAKVLVWGMRTGAFTGSRVGDYVNCNGRVDYSSARNVVNPNEGGANRQNIANAAQIYYNALKDKDVSKDKATDNCASSGQEGKEGWYDPLPGGIQTHPYGEYPHGSPPHVHKGIDIQKTWGKVPVYAARSGTVVDVQTGCPQHLESDGALVSSDFGCGSGYGNLVIIQHDNGYRTLYGHNSYPLVKMGQQVKGGQPIAMQGSTGSSVGAHSHFEVSKNGTQVSPRSVGVPNMQS